MEEALKGPLRGLIRNCTEFEMDAGISFKAKFVARTEEASLKRAQDYWLKRNILRWTDNALKSEFYTALKDLYSLTRVDD